MSPPTRKTPEVIPFQTIRGHPGWVRGVVHLRDERRRIITCSEDGSLRLWDLENGIQIGEDWRDGVDEASMVTIVLSPNGSTVASGSLDGIVRLWDVKTGNVITKWKGDTDREGHPYWVESVCWSGDGERVVSGYTDGTARIWDVKNERRVLGPIKTGHRYVKTVIYSPDSTKIATSGNHAMSEDDGVKIWDARTGRLLTTIKHSFVFPLKLAWTSDGKKLICASWGPSSIFDTATWRQIATPISDEEFHAPVNAISLSHNNRLFVSATFGGVASLWNLDTNLPVGPLLRHGQESVLYVAFSIDGKVLVTVSNNNVNAWDIEAILKNAGLDDLLLPIPHVAAAMLPINKHM